MRVTESMSRFVFGREVSTGAHAIPWVSPVVLGRVLLAGIFVFFGLAKFLDWQGYVAFTEAQTGIVGMSWLVALVGLVEIVGGLSILTGTLARVGALALLAVLVPTTLLFHDFWEFSGAERQAQLSHFLKNLSILGGLLLVVGFGAGKASVDQKLHTNGKS